MKKHLTINKKWKNKIKLQFFILSSLLFPVAINNSFAQPTTPRYRIVMDVAHKQKFWNDPERMAGIDSNMVKRVIFMTDQLKKTASSLNAELSYISEEIKPELIANCGLLFIHIPSAQYTFNEINSITQYLEKGGSLFLVMDEDYWSTLEQTNVNDLIKPFGLQFGNQSPDTLIGGYTEAGNITNVGLKIPFEGGRIVQGGTPFCYSNQKEDYPFGIYKTLKNGGKIIVMGDGMVSLYMTRWKEINDYQCQEFMHDIFKWLLE